MAIGRLGLLVLSSLAALGIAELAYRVRAASDETPQGDDGSWRARYRHMNETIYRASAIEGLVYEPVPGARVEMEYGPAAFNRAAMRDDEEHALEPQPGRTRLAVLGDSLVWGEYLALDDTIPRRLAEALPADRYEVLPFGVTGYDTTQEALWYEHAVRRFHPAIVVVVYCMNDLVIMSGPFERFARGADRARKDAQDAWFEAVAPVRRETIDWVSQEREERASLRLIAHLRGRIERAWLEGHYVDEYLLAFEDEARRARASGAILRLGRGVREDGARGLFVISPVLERWDDYRWARLHAFVREQAERAGFDVLDLREALADHAPDELRIGQDNLHYGRTGSRLVARALAEAIERVVAREPGGLSASPR